jgi:hypothetical protein
MVPGGEDFLRGPHIARAVAGFARAHIFSTSRTPGAAKGRQNAAAGDCWQVRVVLLHGFAGGPPARHETATSAP